MTRAELPTVKIDLQELKRLASGWYGDKVRVETDSLYALVDVVEKAQAIIADCDKVYVMGGHANDFCDSADALRAALTPFTESTNEEA